MSFSVTVEADYRSEILLTKSADLPQGGGNAVFAFLSGLELLCSERDDDEHLSPILVKVVEWYRALDIDASYQLCHVCGPLIQSMWGDGGDSTQYHEDEYEWFRKRTSGSGLNVSEEQFRAGLREGERRWIPIAEVMAGVKFLVELFKKANIEPLEGFYVPEDTIPDFEALCATLEIFAKRRCEVVRLNFS